MALKKLKGKKTARPKKIDRSRPSEMLATGNDRPQPTYDPKWDLETLTKAEDIRKDRRRHGAAIKEGRQQHSRLKSILRGPKDEVEMQRYAASRGKRKPPHTMVE